MDFYTKLYAESISNVQDTSNMDDFIGTYIYELVSSEENMMLIKCPEFMEIKNVVFNLNGNNAPGPDGFGGVFLSFLLGNYWDRCLQCCSTVF